MSLSLNASARVAGVLLALCAVAASAQQPTAPSEGLLLDSLLNTRISSVSKYAQTTTEAPASVTIVSSDEIRGYGYHNLEEVLENVRGLYFSNDHNYPYVGVRGFGEPTDYNDRILLLVDGHTLNERVWGSAPVGSDLPINLAAVERIEVVRGPGSVLYGSSAMFGVINIVTKTGTQLDGVTLSSRIGTSGAREGAVAAGYALGAGGSFAFSALVNHSDGSDQYYAEFDTPATNNGIAHGLDWENGLSALGSLVAGDVTARAGFRSRSKGIPTASYETLFGDSRAETVDQTLWGEVEARRDLDATHHVLIRAYGDQYRYRGAYPQATEPEYTDGGGSTDQGVEANLIWDPTSRARFTLGSEFLHVSRANYHELLSNGVVVSDDAPQNVASLFMQTDLEISSWMSVVAGVRLDKRSHAEPTATPRLAIVTRPDSSTTLKFLYGEAFRSPSPAEADLTTSTYTANPALQRERIRTVEVDLQRRIAQPVLLGMSLYRYSVSGLIDQVNDPSGGVEYENAASATGRGLEMQLDLVPGGPFSTRATYALQRTREGSATTQITNSPSQVATISGIAHSKSGIHSGFIVRHESPRLTLAGTSTPPFERTDVNVGFAPSGHASPAWATGFDVSFRVKNVFNSYYSTPGGFEHLQAALQQDGRILSLSLSRTF